ncbi:unnamed protein product [Candidula unifasciata]|uniref:Activating signal cointegrator 1 n=1 Tax=Candidula unifasciata TaxID=100452 RepID=A0A8S3ZZG3_9EUPU|nr:unnamed protein product [Candidula unifasciata]
MSAMAADVDWFCRELTKFGLDITEDVASYMLSMSNAELEEYIQELIDVSDPKVRVFLQELQVRCGQEAQSNNTVKAYRKSLPEDNQQKNQKKKRNKEPETSNDKIKHQNEPLSNGGFRDMASALTAVNTNVSFNHNPDESLTEEIGIGAKRKTKFVPLFSKEGLAKSVIQLPGRYVCECQAAKHKLINNCINCGRIVCEQEGAGPCVFCGTLVCTPEDQEIIDRGSKKGEKRRQFLMKGGGHQVGSSENSVGLQATSTFQSKPKNGFEQALQHRDKLLEYDRTSVKRTQVIDDECDYYATDANQWLSSEERDKLRKREEELRKSRHGSRRDRKITFDFAGRRVIDAEDDSAQKMYDMNDEVIQQVHYGKSVKNSADIVNPSIQLEPPKFVESVHWGPSRANQADESSGSFHPVNSSSHRIQDKELQEISDEGMCMSMHQPWASLLVAGIKMHEGRTWYSPHRGRLWIASTAKSPSPDDIREHEHMYAHLRNDKNLDFPKDYPTGCLLGCVNVEDCLSQDEYREQYPDGESASPYVFICSNPQQLIVKFPIKGKHKIYKLDPHIHQAAKKGLR